MGDERDPLDVEWWLSERNPHVLPRFQYVACFDSTIAPSVSLDDDELLQDALTKRIYVVQGLEFGIRGNRQSPVTMQASCDKLDWIFRFKWAENIHFFEFATRSHYDSLWASLQQGVLNLVPIASRVKEYLQSTVDGTRNNWFYTKNGLPKIHWREFAHELGVTTTSLRDPEFRLDLFEQVASVFPTFGEAMAKSIIIERRHKPESASTFEGYLGEAADLYHLSYNEHLNHDKLILDPLSGHSIKKFAHDLGRPRGRTKTIPPQFLLQLMDCAVPWVFTYSDWILDAIAETQKLASVIQPMRASAREELAAKLNESRPSGAPMVWPSWHQSAENSGKFCLPDLIQFLLLSCAILISSFGARRIHETLNIKQGCITEIGPGKLNLSIYIEKTLQSMDEIPVPAMIKGVVEVLETLTKPSREFTGDDWLFEVIRREGLGVGKRQRSSDLKNTFKKYTSYNQLVIPEELDNWQLASHQLRRGFAICFYYGFECADLDSLSWFLKHFDPEMTRIYVRTILPGQMARLQREIDERKVSMLTTITADEEAWFEQMEKQLRALKERGLLWESERQGAVVYRLLSIYKGTDKATGKGMSQLNENITDLVRRASARVRISGRSNSEEVFDAAVLEEFKSFARRTVLDPVPGGHSYCSYDLDGGNMEDAECLQVESLFRKTTHGVAQLATVGEPNRLFSGLHPCLECRYGVRFRGNISKTNQTLIRIKKVADSNGPDGIVESASEALERLVRLTNAPENAGGESMW